MLTGQRRKEADNRTICAIGIKEYDDSSFCSSIEFLEMSSIKFSTLIASALISALVSPQDNCSKYEYAPMQIFIKGLSTSDTIDFADIQNGFELIARDNSYRITQFTVSYGCDELIARPVKDNKTMKPKWLIGLKVDNIFSIDCVLAEKNKVVYHLKSKIYYLRGLRWCD